MFLCTRIENSHPTHPLLFKVCFWKQRLIHQSYFTLHIENWVMDRRDRSNAGKEVVKWLWGSLATAPQPTKNKVPILYALEAAFTSY